MTATSAPVSRAGGLPASDKAGAGLWVTMGTGEPEGGRRGEPLLDFRFGVSPSLAPDTDSGVISVALRPLAAPLAWERWNTGASCQTTIEDGCSLRASNGYLAIHAARPVDPAVLEGATCHLYQRLVMLARLHGFAHLVRAWHFVPGINTGFGDEEAYVRFNQGRATAFDALRIRSGQYPAATAVGSPPGQPLTVVMLFSATPASGLENPRQTRAYHYPRRFGPRPPAFARAIRLCRAPGCRLLVSGTASIVGHESRHTSVKPQLNEMLANLSSLLASTGRDPLRPLQSGRDAWRVYLRDARDLDQVEPVLQQVLGPIADILYLQAEICRRELLLEMEGCCQLPEVAYIAEGQPA